MESTPRATPRAGPAIAFSSGGIALLLVLCLVPQEHWVDGDTVLVGLGTWFTAMLLHVVGFGLALRALRPDAPRPWLGALMLVATASVFAGSVFLLPRMAICAAG